MSFDFGNKLKLLREDAGLTQTEISRLLSINKSTVCKWEKGSQEPCIDDIKRLARVLRVSIDTLLDFDESMKEGWV